MKNKEKYIEQMIEAFIDSNACKFKINNVISREQCLTIPCEQCKKMFREWLESEAK